MRICETQIGLPIRLPLLFRRATYNLRGGFLVRPVVIAVVLGCLGGMLSEFEEVFPVLSDWIPSTLFPTRSDPQVAQIVLAAIAGSIMTVVSIVFAILLMTLTLASVQFSPRIILSFVQDHVTQWTLGIFLGTFLYCMAALPAARSKPRPFAPILTVFGAMLLAIACVGWLLYFIHHISRSIRVSHIVDRIAAETVVMIDEMMPWPHRADRMKHTGTNDADSWETAVPSAVSGYIRFVDQKRLVALAKEYRVRVKVLRRVGHFVPAGIPLLLVSKGGRLGAQGSDELRGAFDIGSNRTLQQDVEYGALQIVDIALRAISPAVNDPTTAINCVDQLSRIMIRFAARDPTEQVLYDPPGVVRVIIPWLGLERLLDSAFDQIRMYAKTDLAVSLRLLRAFADIAVTTADPAHRRILIERGRRVIAGCSEKLGEEELGELRRRQGVLEQFLPEAGSATTQ